MEWNGINYMGDKGSLQEAIRCREDELRGLPDNPLQCLIDFTFVHQAEDLADFMQDFFDAESENYPVEAIYAEINEVDINTDKWFITLFSYAEYDSADDDLDWLSEFDGESEKDFVLTDCDEQREAFETSEGDDDTLTEAQRLGWHLVMHRAQELVQRAHEICAERRMPVGQVPVLSTLHDCDVVWQSQPS